jgi:hypothetical protein
MKVFVLAALLMSAAGGLSAHHSIAGIYDRNVPVSVDGVVTGFHFVNPHPFAIVEAVRDGRRETWKLELDNRFELVEIGLKSNTLEPGDRITAKGSRARDGTTSMYVLRIDRPADGLWIEQVGSSPRTGRKR